MRQSIFLLKSQILHIWKYWRGMFINKSSQMKCHICHVYNIYRRKIFNKYFWSYKPCIPLVNPALLISIQELQNRNIYNPTENHWIEIVQIIPGFNLMCYRLKHVIYPLVSEMATWRNCNKGSSETKSDGLKQTRNGGWPIKKI